MADSNPLANLRDIHLPEAVSFWPLGPGYYALLGLLIIVLLLILKRKQHQNRTAPKREALLALLKIENDYHEGATSKHTATELNHLLKRVALVYHPRADVASLHSGAWVDFLEKTSRGIDFKSVQISLIDTPFNPNSEEDLEALLSAARRWIQQRSKPCLN